MIIDDQRGIKAIGMYCPCDVKICPKCGWTSFYHPGEVIEECIGCNQNEEMIIDVIEW